MKFADHVYFTVVPDPVIPKDPCSPSPCGPSSLCRTVDDRAVCTFRPECVVDSDCDLNRACISEKCRDPCIGSCGQNTECRIQNHMPLCVCRQNFTGDPFSLCSPIIGTFFKAHYEKFPAESTKTSQLYIMLINTFSRLEQAKMPEERCKPSCGPNAQCNDNGVCTCMPNYFGDPYSFCKPECTMNSDCSQTRACINQRCTDPCQGTCASGASCEVTNHIPVCSCPSGTTGDAFTQCRPVQPQGNQLLITQRI